MPSLDKDREGIERSIQEYVPGKQVTLAHVIANPKHDVYVKLGLEDDRNDAIGILTITPSEAFKSVFSTDSAVLSSSPGPSAM